MMPKEEKEGNMMNKQESDMKVKEVETQTQQHTQPTPEMDLEQAEQEKLLQAEFARLTQAISMHRNSMITPSQHRRVHKLKMISTV